MRSTGRPVAGHAGSSGSPGRAVEDVRCAAVDQPLQKGVQADDVTAVGARDHLQTPFVAATTPPTGPRDNRFRQTTATLATLASVSF